MAQRRVLRRLSGTHGRSRRWCPPRRHALHQRTAALRHLPRLARGDPDDLFRQDHVLERGPGGTAGLERESAAGMIALPFAPVKLREARPPVLIHVAELRDQMVLTWQAPVDRSFCCRNSRAFRVFRKMILVGQKGWN